MSKLIIFDVDGVLSKEELLLQARLEALIKKIAERFGISRKEAEQKYAEAQKRLPPEKKRTSAYIFIEAGMTREEYFKAMDGVEPTHLVSFQENCLVMLKTIGQKNKIVTYTNSSLKATVKTLKTLGIDKYIDKIYSAEQFKESKPSTENLKKIIKEMGFSVKDTLVVGNSPEKDLFPAHKLGMKTVLFDPEGIFKKTEGVDIVIKDLMELVELV